MVIYKLTLALISNGSEDQAYGLQDQFDYIGLMNSQNRADIDPHIGVENRNRRHYTVIALPQNYINITHLAIHNFSADQEHLSKLALWHNIWKCILLFIINDADQKYCHYKFNFKKEISMWKWHLRVITLKSKKWVLYDNSVLLEYKYSL